jgi:hypothetical protein
MLVELGHQPGASDDLHGPLPRINLRENKAIKSFPPC